MPAKSIGRSRFWLEGLAAQLHIRFGWAFPSLAPVACRACCYQISPGMWTAKMAGNDVIYGQLPHFSTAVLACELIAPQDFSFRQRHSWSRPLDHMAETNNRGDFIFCGRTVDHPSPIEDDLSLSRQNQRQRAFGIADMQRLKVHVQNERRLP